MRYLGVAMILIGIVLPAPAVVSYTSEFLAVDACLDGGGSYDYSRGECDHGSNHPYLPFSSRHPLLVGSFSALSFAGLAMVTIGAVLRRRASRGVV
jgi:hypothetical protein